MTAEYVHKAIEQRTNTNSVRKFITHVWKHSLFDANTEFIREQTVHIAEKLIVQKGGNPKETLIFPVGGALWICGNTSDMDAVFVVPPELEKRFPPSVHLEMVPTGSVLPVIPLDIVATNTTDAAFIPELFLTPDEYIGGNVELAQLLRLAQMDGLAQSPHLQVEAWTLLNNTFDVYTRNWLQLNWGHGDAICKRQLRFYHQSAQLQRVHDVAQWRKQFKQNVADIAVPTFEQYQTELNASHGALSLLPQYTSGIERFLRIEPKI